MSELSARLDTIDGQGAKMTEASGASPQPCRRAPLTALPPAVQLAKTVNEDTKKFTEQLGKHSIELALHASLLTEMTSVIDGMATDLRSLETEMKAAKARLPASEIVSHAALNAQLKVPPVPPAARAAHLSSLHAPPPHPPLFRCSTSASTGSR